MKRKILVVEDEESYRALLEKVLARAGFEAAFASDGERGRDMLRREPFDLVISDWNMPGLDGGQLLRWIRKDPKVGRVPVLMLTVRRAPEQEVAGFECGADDYLAKPYSPKELLARVERLLGPGGAPGFRPGERAKTIRREP